MTAIDETLIDALEERLRGDVEQDVPLAPLTTYRVGGAAELLISPLDLSDLALTITLLSEAHVPWVVLGGGSNVLVSDRGVRGAVVLLKKLSQIEVQGSEIVAGAGVESHAIAVAAKEAGLTGAEFLTCLPGSIGGACLMNARAHGGEISMVLREAISIDRSGTQHTRSLFSEQFDYKRSPFSTSGEIVAQARLHLSPGDPKTIAERMEQIEAARQANHEMDFPSCGCVFKNDRRIGRSSGQLIDACGLKGYRHGEAQVSPFHANFVINLGAATATGIWQIINHIRETVAQKTGYQLELEVQLVGEWD